MESPSSAVNTFVSSTRNAYLLSSISLAAFTAGSRADGLALAKRGGLAVMLVAIWCAFTTRRMLARYVARVRRAPAIAKHPASDFEAWDSLSSQLGAYTCLMVAVAGCMAYAILSSV